MKFMNGIRKTTVLWLVLGTTLVLSGTFFFDARAQGLGISGPHVHKNLTIFLIRGQDRLSGKVPLTLEEALKQKRVIVHETGDVNKLAIENVSQDASRQIEQRPGRAGRSCGFPVKPATDSREHQTARQRRRIHSSPGSHCREKSWRGGLCLCRER